MATQPNMPDLSTLDMTDPETRKFVEPQLDMSDPETKKFWDASMPKSIAEAAPVEDSSLGDRFGMGARGLLQGAGGLTDFVSAPLNAGINAVAGTNLSTSPGHDAGKWIADQLGLDIPDNDMEELANSINEGGIQGLLSAGAGSLISGAKGVTGMVGKALAESPILDTISGMFAGGAGELAEQGGAGPWGQMGAALAGGLTPFGATAAARRLYKEITADGIVPDSAFVRDLMLERGTDTTPGYDPRVAPNISNVEKANQLQLAYDAGKTADELRAIAGEDIPLENLDALIAYREEHGKGGRFVPEVPGEAKLAAEAAAFKPKPEMTAEELFAPKVDEPDLEAKLTAEAKAFTSNRVPEEVPTPAKVADEEPLPENVQSIVDHVDTVTAGWKNSPDTIVYDSFDEFPELDPGSLGIYNPEDGKVYLNANAIDKEAAHRGLTQQEMTNTVMFHEGLGHFGLAQQFRDDLDAQLGRFYEESPYFKKQVDKWIKENPKSYVDDDTVVRAGEEVLAEMSEAGKIPVTYLNQLKNQIKNFARDLGIKLDFSEREIRTILAQAHKAVIDGKGADVRGNGYRSMKASNDNRIRPSDRPSMPAYGADDTTMKKFYEDSAKYHESRAKQAREEGNEKSALRSEQQAKLDRNSASRRDPDYYSKSKENAQHAREQADYHEQKMKERAARGDAKGVDTHRSERDRYTKIAAAYAEQGLNSPKPMKSTYGESEGVQQGPGSKEDKTEPSTINKFRSNRPIEDIMNEAAPEKTKESWEEWIDAADKTKMNAKMAANLAKGTEPPELLAAQEYAVKSANRIHDLSHKVANGTASVQQTHLLRRELERLDEMSQSITDVVANAARLLNSRNMEVGSDKALSDGIRKMLASADLSTQAGIQAAARKLVSDQKKAVRIQKSLGVLGNILNFTRSIWSSYDLSGPFRQARALAHTKSFWNNIPAMFKYWGNKDFYNMTMDSITERATYPRMKKAGLAFTELGTDLSKREEQFMSTWAEKIPGVSQSERAYNGYLNKLRADTFDALVAKLEKQGVDFKKNPQVLKDAASFVNNATGRGDLGKFNQAAPVLAGAFFSPRLMASRLQMLNPAYYVKLSPGVRKEAIKSMLAFGSTSLMVASLFDWGGADVEHDPRSSDFMKVKTGDTRYDILGGYGQYITLAARLLTNETKNAKKEVVELGKRFGQDNAWDVFGKFIRSKFSPNAALVVDARTGENVIGEPFDTKDRVLNMFIPLIAQDTWEVMKKEGMLKGAAMSIPGIFGVSTINYPGPQGADVFGRAYTTDRDDKASPEIVEVKRLEKATDKTILGPVKSEFKVGGKEVKVEGQPLHDYQKLAGEYIMSDLKEEMASPEWKTLSDEEKIDTIKQIGRDARKDARADLFENAETEEEDDEE